MANGVDVDGKRTARYSMISFPFPMRLKQIQLEIVHGNGVCIEQSRMMLLSSTILPASGRHNNWKRCVRITVRRSETLADGSLRLRSDNETEPMSCLGVDCIRYWRAIANCYWRSIHIRLRANDILIKCPCIIVFNRVAGADRWRASIFHCEFR